MTYSSMSRALACWVLLTSGAVVQAAPFDFNSDWKIGRGDLPNAETPAFNDTDWKPVTLPHGFNEDEAFRTDIRELSTGISWYRKTFTLAPDAVGKKVLLEFQGVRHAAEVWVNGKSLAMSENGVMAFGVDASGVVKAGENVVAVRCDNAWDYRERATNTPYQWNDRNFYANYGGINKNVVLHVKDKLHQTLPLYSGLGTTGVYVYAKDIDVTARSAEVTAESQVKNEHGETKRAEYAVTVIDAEGKGVARFAAPAVDIKPGETATLKASQKLTGLNFWSWGYGYLYAVRTELKVDGRVVDSVDTRTGFRKTEFAGGALKLNDRTLHLKGYAQRTTNEWPALGINVPPWLSDFSNGLMVASHGNLVRWMHVTPSKQDIESCDRVGLLQAMPAGDSERDATGRRWEMRMEVMRDAMIYNRNNPSVVFYEAGNKGVSEEHMKEMLALKNQYDPHGGRAMGSREMMGSPTAEWGGEMLYINKSAAKPMWATEYMRDESPRAWADELTPPFHKDGDGPDHNGQSAKVYNRNGDSMAVETVNRWYDYWLERPGTGRRVNGGGVNIIFSDSNTHHRGTYNYRTSGEVDAMRLPKDGFFAHKVMWDGWVDAEKPAAYIVGHWNYAAGIVKTVRVVSSVEKVELLLNGKSLGFGTQSSRFLFTFDKVAYAPGTLTAVGYDKAGAKVCSFDVRTAGEPAAIKLTPHTNPAGFKADGSDVALVDVEVVDADGRRVPTAFDTIDFALDGPAEWRGGIAAGVESNGILAKRLPVELGINRVIVRSTTTAGAIKLTATSGKLAAASITLKPQAAATDGGLGKVVPGSDLRPSLSRGATPAGDSVRPTRVPLDVARITAGNSSETASRAADDNEATTWVSRGQAKDAWIKFDLAKPALVSEVTLKLSGWRSKSYPIVILVDKEIVFNGSTPRGLGYVTLPVKPTRGASVVIRSAGDAKDQDAYDITEITGEKQAAGTTVPSGGKAGLLDLVEVELYGPLPTTNPPPAANVR